MQSKVLEPVLFFLWSNNITLAKHRVSWVSKIRMTIFPQHMAIYHFSYVMPYFVKVTFCEIFFSLQITRSIKTNKHIIHHFFKSHIFTLNYFIRFK